MLTLKGAAQRAQDDGRFDERTICDALLKQAEADQVIFNVILVHTQRVVCAETAAAMELDRFESWYSADGDAKDVAPIAGQIVKTASPPTASGGIKTKRVIPSL